ncbi:Cutinase transcription factor 1 alpha [Talaromyces islandicus]|uniref:Cutinase transcription factor 1 alpha n=1 Tax=Talaromyces islandicus TaxID=28573 RepID=A0A0U1LMK4_TALIS|nr:Cutinase transcription factor 1 alpha [Talaromyces islandicus]
MLVMYAVARLRDVNSDALIRHVRFHQRKADVGAQEKTFFACDRCHKRKVRCDNKTPCRPCQKYDASCRRSNATGVVADHELPAMTPTEGTQPSPMTTTHQQHVEDTALPTPSTSNFNSALDDNFDIISPIKLNPLEGGDVPTPPFVNSGLIDPAASTICSPQQSLDAQNSNYATEEEQTTYELYYAIAEQEQDPLYLVHRSTIDNIMRDESYQSYFGSLHPQWPILHHETFRRCLASAEVRYSIALLGALLDESPTDLPPLKALHRTVLMKVQEKITQQYENPSPDPTGRLHLELAKALLLAILFAIYVGEKQLLSAALGHMATLVSWVRHIGFFNIETIAAQDDISGTEWSRWILREQKARLVFATFRLESQLNFLHDLPPSIRFQELELPLMTTDGAWNACTSQQWEHAIANEPSGRACAAFSTLCSLTLSQLAPSDRLNLAGFFTTADFELEMCAMQSRLWVETKQQPTVQRPALGNSHNTHIENLHGYGQGWPVFLDIWRVMMERFRPESKPYCEDSSEQMAYLTGMTMYHSSMLRVYADLSFLGRLAKGCTRSPSQGGNGNFFMRQYEIRVQQWARSSAACDALWHAAQILDLATQYIPSLFAQKMIVLNPVIIECLYRAALVSWAFCRSRLSCSLCAPLLSSTTTTSKDFGLQSCTRLDSLPSRILDRCPGAVDRVELTRLPRHSDQYNIWLHAEADEGQKSATFIGNTLICACNTSRLVEMYSDTIRVASQKWGLGEFYLGALEGMKESC